MTPFIRQDSESKSPSSIGKTFKEAKQAQMDIWAVDGNCFYIEGKPHVGYAAIRARNNEVLQGTIAPPSAQTAEVIAILAVLDAASPKKNLFICSDFERVVQVLTSWMPVRVERGMTTVDWKAIAHSRFLLHTWTIAKNWQGETRLR